MWFQAAECDAVNASLLTLIVKFNKQQLSDFLTENLPILNPFLPQKTENLRPHSSKSIENATPLPHYRHSGRENATPSSGTFPLASCNSCKGVPPPPQVWSADHAGVIVAQFVFLPRAIFRETSTEVYVSMLL